MSQHTITAETRPYYRRPVRSNIRWHFDLYWSLNQPILVKPPSRCNSPYAIPPIKLEGQEIRISCPSAFYIATNAPSLRGRAFGLLQITEVIKNHLDPYAFAPRDVPLEVIGILDMQPISPPNLLILRRLVIQVLTITDISQ